jgi:hypothetical protein
VALSRCDRLLHVTRQPFQAQRQLKVVHSLQLVCRDCETVGSKQQTWRGICLAFHLPEQPHPKRQ